eukprot:3908358-Rhodomonas_salina.2
MPVLSMCEQAVDDWVSRSHGPLSLPLEGSFRVSWVFLLPCAFTTTAMRTPRSYLFGFKSFSSSDAAMSRRRKRVFSGQHARV